MIFMVSPLMLIRAVCSRKWFFTGKTLATLSKYGQTIIQVLTHPVVSAVLFDSFVTYVHVWYKIMQAQLFDLEIT